MKAVTVMAGFGFALGMSFTVSGVLAAGCGHDVHGAATIEVTQLGESSSLIHYYSPATIIMDDASDPRHRAFGECRGQAVVVDGVANWTGACVWKTPDESGEYVAYWSAKPGDMGTEKRDALHGTAQLVGSGSLSYLTGASAKWTGLANGGSYFCDD
ncbi:MAG: hypothetical protein PVH25_05835 [Burkholderiales bacterium]|jgi:hypothetical protein